MGTIKENLALNLSRLRKEAGLTLIELAKAAKVDKGTLNKWENQKQGFRISNLKEVARVLGVTPEDLIADPRPRETASKSDLILKLYTLVPNLDDEQLRTMIQMAELFIQGLPLEGAVPISKRALTGKSS